MKKRSEPDERQLQIGAARLKFEGRRQKEIADVLSVGQPKVSHLLRDARKHGYLVSRPMLSQDDISDEDWKAVEQRYYVKEDLLAHLKKNARQGVNLNARVFGGSYDEFTFAAAGRVIDLLQSSRRMGIMWGRTIEKVISGIKYRRVARSGPLKCLPLCGEPVFCITQELLEYSASQLAVSLANSLGVSHRGLPCLTGVQAYVRQELLRREADGKPTAWENYLYDIPNYQMIFGKLTGPSQPLVDQVDTVLTGVGIVAMHAESEVYETGVFIRERIAQENYTHSQLDRLIVGDIGGLLVERPDIRPDDKDIVADLNRGWTGIKAHHLESVAAKAHSSEKPGVIVVAYGAPKAAMIMEIIRRGFVNELVIDETLYEALMKTLP